jgi:hypothetical protein
MSRAVSQMSSNPWPELPYASWQDTCAGVHLWTQIVGKIRLSLTPWINHSWQSALYVTASGLTTSLIPCGGRSLQIDFDFIDHVLRLRDSRGAQQVIELRPRSVADFYSAVMGALAKLDVAVVIHTTPNELADAVAFDRDVAQRPYDADAVQRFWRILVLSEAVFTRFRSGFLGKSSPVHFFWGSFDLALTRFSGRRAPLHRGGVVNLPDAVAQEAYSHEVSSAGFWPGGGAVQYPAYYSYAYPEPDGYRSAKVGPAAAAYDAALSEFVLPYDAVRTAADPEAALLEFLQSTYRAAADAGRWDRGELECELGMPGVPRAIST